MSRRRWVAAAVVALGGVLAFGVISIYRASKAVGQARRAVAAESSLVFESLPLQTSIRSGVEYLSAPASYRAAAVFRGKIYVCGPTGVFVFDESGRLSDSFRTGERLPSFPPVAIAATPSTLWIGTEGGGLLSFDGSTWESMLPRDEAVRSITALLPLATGRVALGTAGKGVLLFDGKTLAPLHPKLAGLRVTSLAGTDSDLWVGTFDKGLFHWHAGQVDSFSEGQGLPDKNVLSVALKGDSLYAGTALGIAVFEDGRPQRTIGQGLLARALFPLTKSLLVGTLEEGLQELPLGVGRGRAALPDSRGGGAIEQILELGGKLLALTSNELYEARSGRSLLARDAATLADRNISALAIDPQGQIWTGYFDRGLDVIDPGLTSARHLEDEHLFCINRIVPAPDKGMTAVATANGLVLLDSGLRTRQVLGRDQGLIANHITDIALTAEGMVLATPAGLTFLDAGGARSLYAFHGLVNNHVYALGLGNGRLLAGTLGGASIVQQGLVRASYTTSNSPLGHNWVTAVVPVNGSFFVGTYGGGVMRLDESGSWETFADLSGAISVNPNAMCASGDRVYAGTLGRGLLIFERSQGRWRTLNEGLPSNDVTALAASGGYLYVGTTNGLVRITERTL